jgi:hypothetical protein
VQPAAMTTAMTDGTRRIAIFFVLGMAGSVAGREDWNRCARGRLWTFGRAVQGRRVLRLTQGRPDAPDGAGILPAAMGTIGR